MEYSPNRDLNKTTLAAAVAVEGELTSDQAEAAVHVVLNVIAKTLAAGYGVAITNFGSWHPVVKDARVGRNPQTGETVPIAEKFGVKWTSSPKLKAMINGQAPATISKDPSH